MRTGLPNGFTDLFGMKISNGKAFYIEVKTPTGRIEHKQMEFHHELMHAHAIHGIARSVEDALKIVDEELVGYGYPKEDIWLV
ncbi:VRR-NUC domain-containing protein [Lactobacillus xujianguonis]|uniref:VRR-NUC domain-containing protein n=1 Tax=Lactobacillus xujianguonis TaxID=2495899 RepID=UPI0031BA5A4A